MSSLKQEDFNASVFFTVFFYITFLMRSNLNKSSGHLKKNQQKILQRRLTAKPS